MPKQRLHLVKTDALIDQMAGIGMAQIMEAQILKPCAIPHLIPSIVKVVIGLLGLWICEQIGQVICMGMIINVLQFYIPQHLKCG